MTIQDEALVASQRKRVALALDELTQSSHPFLSTWLLSICGVRDLENVTWTTAIPTFATDGSRLLVNPYRCQATSTTDLKFILLHEAAHCFLGHHHRKPSGCGHDDWNIYCDYVINRALLNDGLALPDGVLIDNDPKHYNWSAEDYYQQGGSGQDDQAGDQGDQGDQADQGDQDSGGQDDQGSDDQADQGSDGQDDQGDQSDVGDFGGTGAIIQQTNPDGSALSDDQQSELIKAHDESVVGSILVGKNADPNSPFTKIAERVTQTRPDWKQTLNDAFTPDCPSRTSYRVPNRRQSQAGDILLPARVKSDRSDVVLAVDSSASVSDEGWRQTIAEAQSILDGGQPFTLLKFTADIHLEQTLEVGDKISTDRVYGGTDTSCVVERANQLAAKSLIIFTDGFIDHDKSQYPDCQVLWVIDYGGQDPVKRGVVNFGEVVPLPKW